MSQDANCWYSWQELFLHNKICKDSTDAACNVLTENSVWESINDIFYLKKINLHELITIPDSNFLIGLVLM